MQLPPLGGGWGGAVNKNMATRIYNNTTVQVEDVENRLEDGVELTVQMTFNQKENTFLITIPEARKAVPREDKPKPENVYNGLLTGIKGTVTAKGNGKVNMDMPPARIQAIGVKAVKADLLNAFAAVMERLEIA